MIGNTFQFAWEVKIIEWSQNNLPSFVIEALKYTSYVGDTLAVVGIMAFFYLCYDKKVGKKIIFNTILGLLVAGELKNIFKRRRPYFDNKNIKCLKIIEKDYDLYDVKNQGFSFPSMHSQNTVVETGTLYNCYKKKPILIIAIIASLIVGVSRFVLGCHYPTDVLTGWILGIIFVILSSKLQDRMSDNGFYLLVVLVGLIGMFFCESSDFYSTYGLTFGLIASMYVDKKYINFKNTKNIVKIFFRLVLAGIVFIAISEGMKIPFSEEVLEADTMFARLYVMLRYSLASFMGLGLTPIVYKYNLLKINNKKKDS